MAVNNFDKRYYTKEKLTRMKVGDYDIKITSETITVKGFHPWNAVTYMSTNENREVCVAWVLSLIEKGILKREQQT